MYAVFEDGSRQYREEGDVVKVDFREADVGARVEFGRVLPVIKAKTIRALASRSSMASASWGRKWSIIRPPSCTNSSTFAGEELSPSEGHRQPYTAVKINHILLAGMEPPASARPRTDGRADGRNQRRKGPAGQSVADQPARSASDWTSGVRIACVVKWVGECVEYRCPGCALIRPSETTKVKKDVSNNYQTAEE